MATSSNSEKNKPAALFSVEVQELDDVEVSVLSGVVHRVVRAVAHVGLVQPLDDVKVPVEGRVVHRSDAAALRSVGVEPLDDFKVTVPCRFVHRGPRATLSISLQMCHHEHVRPTGRVKK